MAEQLFPTKGNLIKVKRSLKQAELGYDLMDRKRNILVRELMSFSAEAKELRRKISETCATAYKALEYANISLGFVSEIAQTLPIDNSLSLSARSVMGVEIPGAALAKDSSDEAKLPTYVLHKTNSDFDVAYSCFNGVKELTVRLAEVENAIYRLALAIKKTQKRANALKNIMIPKFTAQVAFISNALEEKEREEFSRQKVIKHSKLRKQAAKSKSAD